MWLIESDIICLRIGGYQLKCSGLFDFEDFEDGEEINNTKDKHRQIMKGALENFIKAHKSKGIDRDSIRLMANIDGAALTIS